MVTCLPRHNAVRAGVTQNSSRFRSHLFHAYCIYERRHGAIQRVGNVIAVGSCFCELPRIAHILLRECEKNYVVATAN